MKITVKRHGSWSEVAFEDGGRLEVSLQGELEHERLATELLSAVRDIAPCGGDEGRAWCLSMIREAGLDWPG